MSLAMPPNCKFDIYRNFVAGDPYPDEPAQPVSSANSGYITQHVRAGKHGYGDTKVKWTTVLLTQPGVEIRDAFSNGNSVTAANADTILVHDYPYKCWCTAFYVALATIVDRGKRTEHQRLYLDRCQPLRTDCPRSVQNGAGDGPIIQLCGLCAVLPKTWRLTLPSPDWTNPAIETYCSNCDELDRYANILLNWRGENYGPGTIVDGCFWSSADLVRPCRVNDFLGTRFFWQLSYTEADGWELDLTSETTGIMSFTPISSVNFNCLKKNSFSGGSILFGFCTSNFTTATIDPA